MLCTMAIESTATNTNEVQMERRGKYLGLLDMMNKDGRVDKRA